MQSVRTAVGRTQQAVRGVVMRKHRPDYFVLLFMGLLMLLGLIVMYAIGPQRANVLNNAYGSNYTGTYFFIKQLTSVVLALGGFFAFAYMPLDWFKTYATKAMMVGFGACVLLFITGNILHMGSIAQCSLGACRWFNLGSFGSLQPAELLKFGMLLYLSVFLATRMRQGLVNDLHKTLIPVGVLVLAAAVLIIGVQKDMGTGIAMMAIVAGMMYTAGVNRKVGLVLVGLAVVVGIIFIVIAPHRVARITTYFSGDSQSGTAADSSNYQVDHAKLAIGSGGFFGVGIGNSVEATGYLPEAINDSVFAIMGETFGFVGLVVILVILTTLLLRLLRVADHVPDPWMRLVIVGIFSWLGAHVILNVAAMIGVFPLTGITLPLLSFGGTSMIFTSTALGLAFQLSRYTSHRSVSKEGTDEDSSSRRGLGRPRYASRRGLS